MKKMFLVLTLISSSALVASPEKLSMDQFVTEHLGQYKIVSAGGHIPTPDTATALVDKDPDTKDCVLTFPFCNEGNTCDPGYLIFDCAKTEVIKNRMGQDQVTYTVVADANGTKLHYSWSENRDSIVFTNYQYQMPHKGTIELVFNLKKK